MSKIIVNKNDGAKQVIKRIEQSESRNITLVIPRQAAFTEEVSNFEMLREAATELDKEIAIESVDENALALAKVHDFAAVHPLFEGGKSSASVSDILPSEHRKAAESRSKRKEVPIIHETSSEGVSVPVSVPEEEPSQAKEENEYEYEEEEPRRKPRKGRGVFAFGIVIILGLFALVYFAGGALLGRADVMVELKKQPWQDASAVVASASASDIDENNSVIPAQIFSKVMTDTPTFPASGRAEVKQKAKGQIVIHNAYSSDPQTLVATTRFEASDGKIVRLESQVEVPGAKIDNGKIIPSTLVANVIADQPGEAYNIGPMPKLTVPGFKGSPKFDGFYGSLESQLSGGFVGIKPVPTAADIAAAKSKTEDRLKSVLSSAFLSNIPKDYTMIDGSEKIEITKMTASSDTDQSGNFAILAEAKLTAVVFRADDLKRLLISGAEAGSSFRGEPDLSYSKAQPDFQKKQLKFIVSSTGTISPSFNSDAFRSSILGKSESEARAAILAIPGLLDGKLMLRPFWLRSIPDSDSRVKITVN